MCVCAVRNGEGGRVNMRLRKKKMMMMMMCGCERGAVECRYIPQWSHPVLTTHCDCESAGSVESDWVERAVEADGELQ